MAKVYNSPSGAGGDDLAYAFEDLDDWLSKGGFLPADWSAHRAARGAVNVMAMSRKHYREAAEIISARLDAVSYTYATDEARQVARNELRELAYQLCGMFKRDNSAFQQDKFMGACGL